MRGCRQQGSGCRIGRYRGALWTANAFARREARSNSRRGVRESFLLADVDGVGRRRCQLGVLSLRQDGVVNTLVLATHVVMMLEAMCTVTHLRHREMSVTDESRRGKPRGRQLVDLGRKAGWFAGYSLRWWRFFRLHVVSAPCTVHHHRAEKCLRTAVQLTR